MPKIRIADTESDGFVDEATTLWCISSIDYKDDEENVSHFDPNNISAGLAWLHDCDVLVGHNFIRHDIPLLKKLHGWEPLPSQIIVDTLVFSRMLNPKRPPPPGWNGKGTHSVEAWGYRLGRGKPEHKDWSQYSEAMKTRCNEDAVINRLILWELERESEEQQMFYHKARGK